ncbi:response regulator [Methylicorpusculum oleiharenae]|uniref:response regulator n=1 Tax=Methylicorpusculum oleiharenae TaxID=1338687 RepID=UPI00135BEC2C|nr:response regulator [Methylicorpusculum oleiharenae]MCD2449237.1 response regulator [Methylicorpusculum oleiharenae]
MNTKTILLVEDNPSDVSLTRRALVKNAISNPLVVTEDGQEALDYLFCNGKFSTRNLTDLPVVILLDLKLPKIDGLEVLRRIRADSRTRRIPVVILTSSGQEEDISTGYDCGTNSYIRKPINFTDFAETIKQLSLYWLVINEPPP